MLHLALDKVMLMCARRGPGAFFDFDGMNSGLKLPPFEGWPSKSGYSISVWFRVEGVEDPLMMPNYQPRLLRFVVVLAGPSMFLFTWFRPLNFLVHSSFSPPSRQFHWAPG